jgi:hypothetical protein
MLLFWQIHCCNELHFFCPAVLRLQVPIDACIVGSQHSAFLQQASHITGGIYMKPPQPEGLFQYLMVGHMQAFVLSIKFY